MVKKYAFILFLTSLCHLDAVHSVENDDITEGETSPSKNSAISLSAPIAPQPVVKALTLTYDTRNIANPSFRQFRLPHQPNKTRRSKPTFITLQTNSGNSELIYQMSVQPSQARPLINRLATTKHMLSHPTDSVSPMFRFCLTDFKPKEEGQSSVKFKGDIFFMQDLVFRNLRKVVFAPLGKGQKVVLRRIKSHYPIWMGGTIFMNENGVRFDHFSFWNATVSFERNAEKKS